MTLQSKVPKQRGVHFLLTFVPTFILHLAYPQGSGYFYENMSSRRKSTLPPKEDTNDLLQIRGLFTRRQTSYPIRLSTNTAFPQTTRRQNEVPEMIEGIILHRLLTGLTFNRRFTS